MFSGDDESLNRFLLVTVWEFAVPNAAMRLGVAVITAWKLKWKSYKRSNLVKSKFFIGPLASYGC